ncbi:hypothetical protein BDN71DRAFT_1437301 [Pleurotus eryngii]|uniref:Uncharacterized protein n=1 Tax=Pleurotus eryngii TaxID=5323 RepID=A0A9P5ZI49_PLEER|nr:hypothetical protein BDN71DRAFT_1437301 [Pleurotus eryngii]
MHTIQLTPKSTPSPSLASSSSAGPSNQTDKTTLQVLECEARESNSEGDPGVQASVLATLASFSTGYKSQYEVEHKKNIAENRVLLADLGLDKPFFEKPKPKPRQPCKKKEKGSASVRKLSHFVSSLSEEPEVAEMSSLTNIPAVVLTMSASAPTAPAPPIEVPVASTTPVDTLTMPAPSVEVPSASTIIDYTSGHPNYTSRLPNYASPLCQSPICMTTSAGTPTVPAPSAEVSMALTMPVEQDHDAMQVDSVNVEEEEDNTSLLLLEEAPEWLRDSTKDLWKYSRDVKWQQVIQKFILFEKSLGFLKGRIAIHTLANSKNHPKKIGPWVQSEWPVPPLIKNLDIFTEQWWKCILASLGWWVKAVKGVKLDHALVAVIANINWVLGSMTHMGTSKCTSPEIDSVDERNTKCACSY